MTSPDLDAQLADLRQATRELTGQVRILSRAIRQVHDLQLRQDDLDDHARVLEQQSSIGVVHAMEAVARIDELGGQLAALQRAQASAGRNLALRQARGWIAWVGGVVVATLLSMNTHQALLNDCTTQSHAVCALMVITPHPAPPTPSKETP